MPEVKLTRIEPNQDASKQQAKTKRSRSKPKEVPVEDKKAGPKTPRRSRSSSKSRSNSRKRGEVKGAKLYTKKDLEQAETVIGTETSELRPGRRTLRSSSSASTKLTTKTDLEVKSLDDSLVKEKESLLNEIESVSVIGQTLDSSLEQPRYSLRKRGSPASSEKQHRLTGDEHASESPQLAAQPQAETVAQPAQARGCPLFRCGYLQYNRRQLVNLVIVSVLMIVALLVINYFNENSFDWVRSCVVNTRNTVLDYASSLTSIIKSKLGLN